MPPPRTRLRGARDALLGSGLYLANVGALLMLLLITWPLLVGRRVGKVEARTG